MAGEAGAEQVAVGIIAKAAKQFMHRAVGPAGRAGAKDAAEHTAQTGAARAGSDAAGVALRDAEHHVDLDALPPWHSGGTPDPEGLANVPADYKPYGDLDRQSFYDKHYNDAEGQWDYPDNDGYAGERAPTTLQPGDTIDRYGFPTGRYASPDGTPFDRRAIPPTNYTAPYYRYEVASPLPPTVTEGRVAPAFEQRGGGMQYFFDRDISDYLASGQLRQVYP